MKQSDQIIEMRRSKILSIVRDRQEIRVEELTEALRVSPATIRRDLQHLEKQGLLGRFHGGAAVGYHPAARSGGEADAVALCRDGISRFAAGLVGSGDRVFINGSRTALEMLQYISGTNVRVFTNNGSAAGRKYPAGVSVVISGGELRSPSGILTGDCAMRNLLMESADKAFIGCAGISPNGEVLCGIPTELSINETMVSHAREYYILADHTKIGKTSSYASCSLEKPGTVITDEKAPADVVEQLRSIGMKVVQVEKD